MEGHHEEALCTFCGNNMESIDHLLLHCQPVLDVWTDTIQWWGVQWVTHVSVYALLIWWKDWKLNKKKKMIWDFIPMAVMWSIWNLRNSCRFDHGVPIWRDVKERIKLRVAFWIRTKESWKDYSIDDFLFNLKSMLVSI